MPFSAGGLEKAASGVLKAGGGKGEDSKSIDDDVFNAPRRQFKSYHRGGKVRKTGPANLKKGEVVLTKKQARKRRSK
jgi:hypothetical protein